MDPSSFFFAKQLAQRGKDLSLKAKNNIRTQMVTIHFDTIANTSERPLVCLPDVRSESLI